MSRNIVVGLALAAGLAGVAFADSAVRATLEELNACSSVAETQARLACYDRAAPKVHAALDVATEEDKTTLFGLDLFGSGSGSSGEATKPEDFGKKDLPKAEATETGGIVTEITAPLVEHARNPDGYDVFVLDNGQVWRAKEPSGVQIPKDLTGIKVRIRTGSMGAYFLSREDGKKSVAVTRVR